MRETVELQIKDKEERGEEAQIRSLQLLFFCGRGGWVCVDVSIFPTASPPITQR